MQVKKGGRGSGSSCEGVVSAAGVNANVNEVIKAVENMYEYVNHSANNGVHW